MQLSIFEGLADLPHFNPDLDGNQQPGAVIALRQAIRSYCFILLHRITSYGILVVSLRIVSRGTGMLAGLSVAFTDPNVPPELTFGSGRPVTGPGVLQDTTAVASNIDPINLIRFMVYLTFRNLCHNRTSPLHNQTILPGSSARR